MKQAPPVLAGPREITGDPPDGELIERSRCEPDLFALLFRRHAGGIARYAARRLGAGPAEDIVAETFLAAFRQRGGYDVTRADARPWLYGIAGNLIRRHHRDEARELRALARAGPIRSPSPSPTARTPGWPPVRPAAPWLRRSPRSIPASATCCCSSPGPA